MMAPLRPGPLRSTRARPPSRYGLGQRSTIAASGRVSQRSGKIEFSVALRTMWPPYDIHRAAERPLAEFLTEPRSAADTILYRRMAARVHGGEEGACRLADAALADQMVRYDAFRAERPRSAPG